ncbi:MAG TPA: hypothetical protein VL651_06075 [Bacteroidia bacterium]|jgi:hypothetical protein|nr:hypothetical protein [Bacteroidia bacterium]
MIAAALLQASKCEGSLNEREIAAKAIFSGNEKIVSTITSDFIRKNHADSFGVTFDSTFANCNCITDQFADQLANEYDLVSLVQMKNEPQKCLEVVIDRLLNKNDRGVLHCLDGN